MNIITGIELNIAGNRRSGIRRVYGDTRGNPWSYSEAEVIRMIRGLDGVAYEFWVRGSTRTPIRVLVAGIAPHLFLKTEADGIGGNNLLALPERRAA